MKIYILSISLLISTICFGSESPNFLWLVCEDQSLFFSMYGDSSAKTPNLDQLAKDGIVYQNCYTPSPVCAPSRSSLITGMYPTTIGTHHMRAYKKSKKRNSINPHSSLPYYSAKPKKPIRFFTEYLRANGYYCSNNSKEDYNMTTSPLAWDESNKSAHWRNRHKDQSFFSVFNFYVTHESNIWKNKNNYSKEELEKISKADFLPDNDKIKIDLLTNYKNIEKLDQEIGLIINQLKEDSLYDNTIIFFFSDHGGPFPKYKRSIYETGIRVPMIAKWITDTIKRNQNQFISFVDFAPTILEAANIKQEFPFEGVSFFKKEKRQYIYAATDRFDEYTDKRRCVRGGNFKLIYNADTTTSIYKPINYRKEMKMMQILDSLNQKNKLNTYFSNWFLNEKERFELYEVSSDYYESKNLIHNPKYKQIFRSLRKHLFEWMDSSDFGNISESNMLEHMFTESISIPKLNAPNLIQSDIGYLIESNNLNTSVGWRNKNETTWNIYQKNEIIHPSNDFEILLFRPGYEIFIKAVKK